MRVLVTGALGFVGRHVTAELSAAGHLPLRLDRDIPGGPSDVSASVEIRDAAAVAEAVRALRPDAGIHLAGIAFAPAAWSDPGLVYSVNLLGTVNVLEAFRQHAPAARLLAVSTSQVYGPPADGQALDESSPLRPDNLYAVSKAAADQTALLYAARYGAPVLTARPCNHIGPGQSRDFVVPSFAGQLAEIAAGRREPVLRVGNLDSVREFLDVRDVARAYRLLVERGAGGRAYNIAAGRAHRIGDLLDILCRRAGVAPRIEVDAALFRPTDVQPQLVAERIARDVGWAAQISIEDSLRAIYDAARASGAQGQQAVPAAQQR